MFDDLTSSVNRFRDSLGLKDKISGTGSFRNVPFLVMKEQRQSGGRRIVKREYPLRDAGGTNDLGRKLRERNFTLCVLGNDADVQRDALIEAFEGQGAGELVHPAFGTLSVLIDSYECRSSADELYYHEFTLTVYPESTDTAPEAAQDTQGAVTKQTNALTGSLSSTLTSVWQTVEDGTAGATALVDSVTGIFDDIYGAVANIGVIDDVNGLLSSITAAKASAEAVINQPSMLAAQLLGAISGIAGVADASASFNAYETLDVSLARRQRTINVSHIDNASAGNIDVLFHTAINGTQASQASAASGVLTQAIDASASVSKTPQNPRIDITTGTASSVSQPVNVSDTINPDSGSSALSSNTETVTSDWPLFESAGDIERVAVEMGSKLDAAALTAADKGYAADSGQINLLRLLTVQDLRLRGLQLAGATYVVLGATEPALVTLYRETGNATQWQRLARRNAVSNPLFVPGGVDIEVIND